MVAKTAALGAALAGVVAATAWAVWGAGAAFAAGGLGLTAAVLQTLAVVLLQPRLRSPSGPFMKRWMLGTALRFAGVVMVGAAVWLDRTTFPPLPSAVGFLSVMVPLLFFEARLIR